MNKHSFYEKKKKKKKKKKKEKNPNLDQFYFSKKRYPPSL